MRAVDRHGNEELQNVREENEHGRPRIQENWIEVDTKDTNLL